MRRWQILFPLAVFICAACAFGQGGGSVAITGTVTDPSGAVLAGAHIKVTQKNTGGVALIEGFGGIVSGRSRRSPLQGQMMGSDTVAAAFRAAVRDDRARAREVIAAVEGWPVRTEPRHLGQLAEANS